MKIKLIQPCKTDTFTVPALRIGQNAIIYGQRGQVMVLGHRESDNKYCVTAILPNGSVSCSPSAWQWVCESALIPLGIRP